MTKHRNDLSFLSHYDPLPAPVTVIRTRVHHCKTDLLLRTVLTLFTCTYQFLQNNITRPFLPISLAMFSTLSPAALEELTRRFGVLFFILVNILCSTSL